LTAGDASDSVGCTTKMDRHLFLCGSPRCPRCSKIVTEREKAAAATAFAAAVAECEAYSKGTTSEEAKAVALNIAMRITRRAKQ
jgi:hypothetical protein